MIVRRKTIPDWDAYEAASDGSIWRVRPGNGARLGRPKDTNVDKWGYHRVIMSQDGRKETVLVHRLVASAFIGPIPHGMQVNHRDGDKDNNGSENLEYVTPSENARHAVRMGLRTQVGESHKDAKLRVCDIGEIRRLRQGGRKLQEIADMFGVNNSTIHRICSGEMWSHVPLFTQPSGGKE